MAHHLEIINGKASMAFTGDRNNIWHGLGTEVSTEIDTDAMLQASGLDWTVEKRQLTMPSVNDKGEVIHKPTDMYGLVRSSDDSVLDYITKDWTPCQNHQAFEFFREFVEEGDLEWSTAGSIHNGQNVWALARIKNPLNLFGEDRVENYILFSNPHKYGKSINIRLVMERVCCNNTLSIALNENARFAYTQNHRNDFNAMLAKKALSLANNKIQQFEAQANKLASIKLTNDGLNNYLSTLFPMAVGLAEGESKEKNKNFLFVTAYVLIIWIFKMVLKSNTALGGKPSIQ